MKGLEKVIEMFKKTNQRISKSATKQTIQVMLILVIIILTVYLLYGYLFPIRIGMTKGMVMSRIGSPYITDIGRHNPECWYYRRIFPEKLQVCFDSNDKTQLIKVSHGKKDQLRFFLHQ